MFDKKTVCFIFNRTVNCKSGIDLHILIRERRTIKEIRQQLSQRKPHTLRQATAKNKIKGNSSIPLFNIVMIRFSIKKTSLAIFF